MKASHKLAEEVYKKSQKAEGKNQKGEPEQEPAGKSGGKDDKVVDAEFKVEDDKK
jgi:hypothetical protein